MLLAPLKRLPLRELLKAEDKPKLVKTDCKIRAVNDVEAIERWLDEYFLKPTTFRTYKKEAERFLIWCSKIRHTDLAHFNRDDVDAYILFLQDPKPREIWCGPRRKKGEHWYPFTGPLSTNAIKSALVILNSLMSYLVSARYIDFNPFQLVRKKNKFTDNFEEQRLNVHERILNDEEWQILLLCLIEEDENNESALFKKNRLKFLLAVLYFLGLRIEELANATFKDCHNINSKWWFFVRGKGDRLGKVPINTHLLHQIMTYRQGLGLAPLPNKNENLPIISKLGNINEPLTARQMSNLLKALAIKAANKFVVGSTSYEKLLKFSPHWLRHLSASRQDLAGISFTNIKSNLRHQNEQTTRIYVHAHDDIRHRDMEKLKF